MFWEDYIMIVDTKKFSKEELLEMVQKMQKNYLEVVHFL